MKIIHYGKKKALHTKRVNKKYLYENRNFKNNINNEKEKFKNTTLEKQYSTYGNYTEEKCPECGENSVKSCPCAYSDKICGKGHSWYTDRNGNIKLGNPH